MQSNIGHMKMTANDRDRLTTFRSGRKPKNRKHSLRDHRTGR